MTDEFDAPLQPWEREDMCRLRKGLEDKPFGGSMIGVNPPPSEPDRLDIYRYGEHVGFFRMTPEDADTYCKKMTESTSFNHDWHYVGALIRIIVLRSPIPDLIQAIENYMAAFGQALDAHGIPYGPQQADADRTMRALLKELKE